jgi:1-acyl-sn-glycerol-3-phosphate acyltransferase
VSLLQRRLAGEFTVDEWGLDRDLVEVLSPVFGLRWGVDVDGADLIPTDGPVLIVANRRLGASEPFVLSRGVRLATGRFVRLPGVPDVAAVGPALRRLGAVVDHPDEVAGLLRAGEVVAAFCDRDLRHRHHVGPLRPATVAPALAAGAAVVPVALVGREVGRRWRLVVGSPVDRPAARGPLAAAELADTARRRLQTLLDDALPPRWPFAG